MQSLTKDKEVQRIALEYFTKTDEGRKLSESLGIGGNGAEGPKSFKAPEGFGNVVGVGANPVIEAMTAQLEETKKTNEILSMIANGKTPESKDFTKDGNPLKTNL